jgi:hypothetical protein
MFINRFLILSLALAGCAAAYAIGRNTRHLEERRVKDAWRAWKDEGGNLAPVAAPSAPRP